MNFRDLLDWAVLKDSGKSIDEDCLQVAAAAALRTKANWTFPCIVAALVLLLLLPYSLSLHAPEGIWLGGRIILFDYLVFFVGWIAAWNGARRWRREKDFIEAIAATNILPETAGKVLFAGMLQIWFYVFVGVAVMDMLLLLPYTYQAFTEVSVGVVEMLLVWICAIPAYLLLAWFHLETMRISYWMFSVVALPGKNLRDHAILNAILIFLYVMALTTIGSMIAGVLAGVGAGLYLIVQSIAGNALGWGDYWLDVMWYSAAIPGLVLVGMLKRSISGSYEKAFRQRYLYMLWWGAAETTHPEKYPPTTTSLAPPPAVAVPTPAAPAGSVANVRGSNGA